MALLPYYTRHFLFLLFALAIISCGGENQSPLKVTTSPIAIKDSLAKNRIVNELELDTTIIDSLHQEEKELFEIEEKASNYTTKDDAYPTFDRGHIDSILKYKVKNGIPLVVHIFVPLCDNTHQGIVPTTESLGNGFSLRTNLYWAVSNGMKRYFKEKKGWKLLQSKKNVYGDSTVLERVVFVRTYPNQAKVYLVADAYRGDKMMATVNDCLRAMSNNYTEKLTIDDSTSIQIHGQADLVVFNGHNGMLDFWDEQPKRWFNPTQQQKDMVAICCYANEYWEREAMRARAYPIVRAKNLIHPGAFVISGIVDKWAMLESVEQMRLQAGANYCNIHNCSKKTSRNLFYKGWRTESLQDYH